MLAIFDRIKSDKMGTKNNLDTQGFLHSPVQSHQTDSSLLMDKGRLRTEGLLIEKSR